VVPTAQREQVAWRYTFSEPAGAWFKPEFDASAWKLGQAGFGTRGTPGAIVRTEWRSRDIWLRREFNLPLKDRAKLRLLVHHDEDAEVYLNGVPAVKVAGFTKEYEDLAISAEARASLRPVGNVLAVHCHQTTGGQYIDAGLAIVVAK
jgi:hypothetical protein